MQLPALIAAIVLAPCLTFAADTAGDEALRHVDHQTLSFTKPATRIPCDKMVDGPLLGNGDLGVTVAGAPEALRFHIGKNDFWGQKTQSPQTVGRIEISTTGIAGAPYAAACDLRRATWQGSFTKDNSGLRVRAFVDANANRMFIETENTGTTPLELAVKRIMGAAIPAPSDDFLYAPDGDTAGMRRVGVATRVLGPEKSVFTLEPGARATVVVAILSDLDARDPHAEAKAMIAAMTPAKAAEVAREHEAWWAAFWKKSFIEIPDKTLERNWYASQYTMASCSRAGKVAPGLWGNWITMDKTAWHGDYHLNYNFQSPFFCLDAANHADATLPYYEAIMQSVPRGQKIAAARGWKGIHLPVSIGPWGTSPEGDASHWGQQSNAAYSAVNFIRYWQLTQDKAWLQKTGYPFLREVEKFWTDYLKFDGTRYVIEHDAIHEGSGGAGRSGVSSDFNPILSIGLVRSLYASMLETSEVLGVDADLRPKWREILAKLSAFPTQEKNGKTVFRYTEQGTAWWPDNTLGIQHIFPAAAIGLDSDPKLLQISRDTIDAMNRWRDNNGASNWYTACVRVGYDPEKTLAGLRAMYDRHAMPNGIPNFGGGGVENASPTLAITEMLMQSHEGVIRIFPVWPRKLDARFGTLRARGAFLVSAEIKAGKIGGVRITSEKGMPLTVQNPWPGKQVVVSRGGKPAETVTGERFTLKTAANERLIMEPR